MTLEALLLLSVFVFSLCTVAAMWRLRKHFDSYQAPKEETPPQS